MAVSGVLEQPKSTVTVPRPAQDSETAGLGSGAFGNLEVTFVLGEPARRSFFALWDPDRIGGLFGSPVQGLKATEVELVFAGIGGADPTARRVVCSLLPMASAIDVFANLSANEPSSPSARAWSTTIRSALAIVADGRVLPSVSEAGWESWQLKPLRAEERAHAEALALALPAAAHCIHVSGSSGVRVAASIDLVLGCWDAVADCLLRTAAAPHVVSSPLYADVAPIRAPHLKSWASDLHNAHSPGAGLGLMVVPPESDGQPWSLILMLRSHLDPSLIVEAADLWRAPAEVFARFGHEAESDLLVSLRRGAQAWSGLTIALQQSAPSRVAMDSAALDSLLDHLDALSDVGIEVRWPSGLIAPDIERRVVVSAGSPSGALPTVTDLDSLMTVNWEFLLDGLALSAGELAILSEAKRPLIQLRGKWVRLDRRARERLREAVPNIGASDALAGALGDGLALDSVTGDDGQQSGGEIIAVEIRGAIRDLADRLLALDGEREEPDPPGLAAELRPYQRRGLAWMLDLCSLGLGGCLADDMGLGKTIQLLALHSLRDGPTLVVCPTSLIANWEREAHKFLPGTIVHRFHGASRSLRSVQKGDLVITTYGVVRSDSKTLASVEWDLVVADEAQYAKNPRSRTAKALREIPCGSRLALTGTPVENRLSELWSILDWTVPGLLGPLETFRRRLATPIERDGDPEAVAKLAAVVKPFLLRRKKTDPGIAPELPPKVERDVVVPLTPEQVTLYQATTKEVLAELSKNEGIARHGLVLKLLTSLKQITNHPAQFLGETSPLLGRSGKLAALDELLVSATTQGQSSLVFTQYVSMGKLLVQHLRSRGISVEMLHGGLTIRRRQALVDDFQAGRMGVLVLSLKAGGTGLNLTKATNVIHYDRWWNPAVEDQATDRAYRIGQNQTVTVHRLVTEGTVEDRVAELLRQKRELADRVVGSGEAWIGNLDDDALAELVTLAPLTTEVNE